MYQKYSIKDVPLGPRLSYVGDVDNDGLMELVIGSGQDADDPGMITVYKFQDAAFVEIFSATNNNLYVGGITVGDITNDGKNELIVGWGQPDFPGDITVYKRLYEGIGLYWKGFRYHGGQHALCVGDSNNDGRNELVVGLDYTGRAVYVLKFHQDSEGEFKEEIEWFYYDSDVLSVDVCDSNENGINELLVGGGPYDWYDARIFEHVPGTSEYREIWRSPKIGRPQAFCLDLDADGKQEMVIGDGGYDYGDNGVWVYQWNGFEYIRTMIASDKRPSFPGGCGSFFGDGIPQFAITNIDPGNPLGNSVVRLYEIESGGLRPVWKWKGYSGPFSPVIGDVDNDKHQELLIYDRSNPESVTLRIFAGVAN
jgi:hypothetical protein